MVRRSQDKAANSAEPGDRSTVETPTIPTTGYLSSCSLYKIIVQSVAWLTHNLFVMPRCCLIAAASLIECDEAFRVSCCWLAA